MYLISSQADFKPSSREQIQKKKIAENSWKKSSGNKMVTKSFIFRRSFYRTLQLSHFSKPSLVLGTKTISDNIFKDSFCRKLDESKLVNDVYCSSLDDEYKKGNTKNFIPRIHFQNQPHSYKIGNVKLPTKDHKISLFDKDEYNRRKTNTACRNEKGSNTSRISYNQHQRGDNIVFQIPYTSPDSRLSSHPHNFIIRKLHKS